MWAGGDCRATRSLRLGSASALRLIWPGAVRQCPRSPRLDAWMPAAASSVASAACCLPWPWAPASLVVFLGHLFTYISLGDSSPCLIPCLALPCRASPRSILRVKGRSSPHCLATMRSNAKRGGGRRGCCLLISPFHRFRVVPFELQFVCGLCSEAQAQAQAISIRFMRCGEYQ